MEVTVSRRLAKAVINGDDHLAEKLALQVLGEDLALYGAKQVNTARKFAVTLPDTGFDSYVAEQANNCVKLERTYIWQRVF